ncbi:MAG: branched-chain amino acid transaminase [Acidimicrobiia bacterium]
MEPSEQIWVDGELVAWADATVHVLSHALHYGSGVFEGIRAYQTPDGTAVFRLTDHLRRLHRSAKVYRIPMTWSIEDLAAATFRVLSVNRLEHGYIRPIVFYGLGSIGLDPAPAEVRSVIAAWRWGTYLGEEGVTRGIRTQVSSWRRIDASSFVPSAKGTGQYLNSILAKQEAVAHGYDEAIMLNRDGHVSEGSGENLFVVRGGTVFTPPLGAGILDGITRHSVMTLLREDGVEVVEAAVTRGDLTGADEVFMTGTAAEVTPVREVDGWPVGPGEPGPVTRRAQDLYHQAVTGRLGAYRHWLEFVED